VFTIFDAIDRTAALGVKHMSLSGNALLDKDAKPVGLVTLADKDMEAIKTKVVSAGISWPFVNTGVVNLSTNEAQSRKVFEFARKWGVDTLVAEPGPEALDVVEKLCKEYSGNTPLYLKLRDDKENINLELLSRKFRIKPVNEMVRKFKGIPEVEVEVVY